MIAVTLHLLAFALLFTGYLVNPRDRDPEPLVFELHDAPSERAQPDQPAETEARRTRQMELPEFEFEAVELPPTTPRERPRPEPQPRVQPEQQSEPEPRREPEPQPEPEPERMSLAEFRERHGAPREPEARPRPQQRRQVEAPRIDTSNIRSNLQSVMRSDSDQELVSRLSDSDQRELERYFARLRTAIERAWNQPSSATAGMSATVRFSLSGDGRVSGARVVGSSGSDAFNRSIVEAFERLGSFDPPPDRESYTPNLTFRID